MEPGARFRGRRIVILGLARQGVALARYLAGAGARVAVSDLRTASQLAPALASLEGLPIEYALDGHPDSLLDGAELVCLSGGVDANVPLAQAARRRGIPLSNDSQIFLEVCPAGLTTIGITGSAGKTTTTTLVGRMLKAGSPPLAATWVGGNIGNPLIAEVDRMKPEDMAVLELSSFQLEIMTRSPKVAAVLNITPNHLDRHGTMEAYAAAKSNILRNQAAESTAVLGLDDPGARALAPLARGRLVYFSAAQDVAAGAFLRAGEIVVRRDEGEQLLGPASSLLGGLRGPHNVLNALAACAISSAAGAPPEAMRAGMEGFTGVEHRLEFVREHRGVRWYNDSIASAPERVVAALNSFDEPIVLLAGGRDKKLPWEEFARLAARRLKALVLFGEAGPLIERAVRAAGMEPARCARLETLADALHEAARRAAPGDVVLLSPGGTSFDAFRDFAERGETFKEWVRQL